MNGAGGSLIPKTLAAMEAGIQQGLHLGAQVYVSIDLRTIVNAAVGEADSGSPMRIDTLLPWMSSTKPVTAVAVGMLWEEGGLDLDDPVSRHIPEFGVKGKEAVTIRHLLTHTGGIRLLDVGWPEAPWEQIIEKICSMRLEPRWTPGKKAGYHTASSWFILAEIVQRLGGAPFSHWVRKRIFEPIGMKDAWIGMPLESYREHADRMGKMFDTAADESKILPWSSEIMATVPNPAANGIGPARELGRFYEMLLNRGERAGHRVLRPQTVEALTARHRVGVYDSTFRHIIDWGLGFIPDSKQYGVDTVPYGYGRHCSSRTFGHSGYRSSTGFADPDHRLAVAVAFNGAPSDEAHEQRMRLTLESLYQDLGLAEGPEV